MTVLLRRLVAAMLLLLAPPLLAQPLAPEPPIVNVPPLRAPADALAEDAALYAAHFGVAQAQAVAELRAQGAAGALVEQLAATHADRFAGVVIEHAPAWRIAVLLTGEVPVPDEAVLLDGTPVTITFRTGALATRAQVLAAIAAHRAEIASALRTPPGFGADPRTGAMVVTVGAGDAGRARPGELADRFSALAGVPVEIEVPGEAGDFALAGGDRVWGRMPDDPRRFSCTAGFVVTDGAGAAISTAAHCPDDLEAAGGAALHFVGGWGAGAQDVQIDSASVPLAPVFHAGPDPAALRPVTAIVPRSRLPVGSWVCHTGIRSGYSCAEIVLADYAPPGELCAGACPASWLLIAGPSCAHGDSGGPVFLGTAAIGLVKGGSYRSDGRCNLYYAMSLDQMPAGWRALLATP